MAGDFDISDDDYIEDKRCPQCGQPQHDDPLDCPERKPQPARLGRSAT